MKYKVPQLEPYFDEDELNNLKKVIETRWITEGPFSEEFLEDIKKLTKAEMLKNHKKEGIRIAYVGNSVTDLVCKNVADVFVGFGGVVNRPKVEEQSDIYIPHKSLAPLLLYLLEPTEIAELYNNGYTRLLDKAGRLITTQTNSPQSL